MVATLLAPATYQPTLHEGTPGCCFEEDLQRATVDRYPLLPRKLLFQKGCRDLTAAAANYKHVGPRSQRYAGATVAPRPNGKCDLAHIGNKVFCGEIVVALASMTMVWPEARIAISR